MTRTIVIGHNDYMAQVIEAAGLLGWHHLHVRKSIGKGKRWTTTTNRVGWPDLFLWNSRKPGFAAIEIKVGDDLPTQKQLDVLAELALAGTLVAVAYPEQFDQVLAMLQRRIPFPTYEGKVRPE